MKLKIVREVEFDVDDNDISLCPDNCPKLHWWPMRVPYCSFFEHWLARKGDSCYNTKPFRHQVCIESAKEVK